MKTTKLFAVLAALFFVTTISSFAGDKTPQSRTYNSNESYELREGNGYTGSTTGSYQYPVSLDDQYKQAVESGNMIEAKRIQDEINKTIPVNNTQDGPVGVEVKSPVFNNGTDWYGTDVTVYVNATLSGPPGFRRLAMCLGEDYNLYLAIVTPQISSTSHVYAFRSSNGGVNWSQIGDLTYGGYFGQIAIQADRNATSGDDSTRILLFYTYSANSSLNDASLGCYSFRRDGSASYATNGIITPGAGNRLSYPSCGGDGAYYTTASYHGVVVSEENNTTGVTLQLRYTRSTTWGRTFAASVSWGTSYDDRYPSLVFHRGPGSSSSNDSVWVAVERHFSATNFLTRVISSPFSPNTAINTWFVPPTGTEKYEKPSLALIQKQGGARSDSAIICVIKDGVALYHFSADGGINWTTDASLGGGNGNNKIWVYASATYFGNGPSRFLGIWGSADGDSLNLRRGYLNSMGTTVYKRNSSDFSTSLAPVGVVYSDGTNLQASFAYAGFGPANVLFNQEALVTGINQNGNEVPASYSLSQNYPNPFNPVTNIKFTLPTGGLVKLVIFDIMGREVATVINKDMNAGSYTADFDASMLSSGVYFYKITSGSFTDTKKMMLVK